MNIPPFLIGLAASGATLLGGVLALHLRHRLGIILGLAAGAVVGVACFDLLPEAVSLDGVRYETTISVCGLIAGFVAYCWLARLLAAIPFHARAIRKHIGPAVLSYHSLIDGLTIGVAFSLSTTSGWLVATAVLAHDIADGANTVSLSLGSGDRGTARRWLLVNALAPPAGVLIGERLHVPGSVMGPILALVAGMFLAIGLTELGPRSFQLRPRLSTGFLGMAGAALIFGVARFAG